MNERMSKRWLAASLMLNLFLVAGIGSAAWRWHAATSAAPPAAQRGLRFAAEALTPDQRGDFRQELRRARRAVAAAQQDGRTARQDALRLLAAEPFDRAAVGAALARAREADMAVRARNETAVVDFASTLSTDDRRKLVDGLQHRSNLGVQAAPQKK